MTENKPRPLYHNQEEAIHQLLQRGETITLTYVVTEKESDGETVATEAAHD